MTRKTLLLILLAFIIGGTTFLLMSSYPFGSGFLAVMSCLTLLWIYSLVIKDASIIDIFWGPGFAILGWYYFSITSDTSNIRNLTLCSLVTIWAVRLGGYIFMRNHGNGEDFRYKQWRKDGGKNYWWFPFLRVFLLQGLLLWIVGSVLLVAQLSGESTLQSLDYIGIVLWAIGFLFEAVGDYQLTNFKKNPANKGKVMNQGLWHYTRHPNYFGNAVMWWGFFLFALSTEGGWMYVFSPILMTFLLVRVSGAALLESTLKKTKPKYKDYIEKTSAFVPWFPKK
ncbi:MAG: DUF1295 domain-containing protein [Chitinophagales bacterium]